MRALSLAGLATLAVFMYAVSGHGLRAGLRAAKALVLEELRR